MAKLEERIQEGAQLLDRSYLFWFSKVDRNRLDMASQQDGLLEQLYGGFAKGLEALGLTVSEAYEYGFDISDKAIADETRLREWENLTDAWKTFLRKQPERAATQKKQEPLAVGDFVRFYKVGGVYLRRITGIYATSVDSQKIYELEDPYKNLEYATRLCIER